MYQFQNQFPVFLVIRFPVLLPVTVDIGIGGPNLVPSFVEMHHIDAVACPAPVHEERIALVKDEPLIRYVFRNQALPYSRKLLCREDVPESDCSGFPCKGLRFQSSRVTGGL